MTNLHPLQLSNGSTLFDILRRCNFSNEKLNTKVASAGNRTRAARVAGEHSTTEPPMLIYVFFLNVYILNLQMALGILFPVLYSTGPI